MERAHLLKISLILATLSLILYSAAYFGDLSFSLRGSASQGFAEGTYIGSIDVSGKSRDEAISHIESFIDEWKTSGNVALTYKTLIHDVDLADFHFSVASSVEAAEPGSTNDLLVELDERVFEKLLMPSTVRDRLDEGLLLEKLLEAASSLEQTAEISLEPLLPEEDPIIISSVSVELPEEVQEIREMVAEYPSLEIQPKSQFSLLGFAEEKGLTDNDYAAYSLIASAIYMAVLPTNFSVIERHIGSTVPEYIEPGYEAKVDFSRKMDFKLYNPNAQVYTLLFKMEGKHLNVSVQGLPFLHEYKVAVSGKEEFKPRTIKQYSPLILPGQKSIEREGEPGVLVTISRDTISLDGELLERELLSEDFYHPIHRIELLPLQPAVQSADPQGDSQESNYSDVSLPDGVKDDDGTMEEGTDETGEPPSGTVEENPPQDGKEDDGLWGNPDEEPK